MKRLGKASRIRFPAGITSLPIPSPGKSPILRDRTAEVISCIVLEEQKLSRKIKSHWNRWNTKSPTIGACAIDTRPRVFSQSFTPLVQSRQSFLNRTYVLLHTDNRKEMSTSPTPEERAKADKEAKAREALEQAALPYQWNQTIKDVDITIPVPATLKGRDLDVVIKKNKLKAGIKGQTPLIDVRLLIPYENAILTLQRAISRNQSPSTNLPGHLKPPRKARRLAYI